MINLYDRGLEGDEIGAARALQELIIAAWPWAQSDPEARIEIIPKVQCHGQRVKDIDVVVLARLPHHVSYRPVLPIRERESGPLRPTEVWVRDLCVVIEVKSHAPQGVRFSGTHAMVKYVHKGHVSWHSATQQSEDQKYSLLGFLGSRGLPEPWVVNLLWFRNLQNSDLPKRPHNLLGQNSSWDLFLNVIGSSAISREASWVINGLEQFSPREVDRTVAVLTETIEPTVLDRRRMDLLTRTPLTSAWVGHVGTKQILLRGRGGAGKTMIMLQLANKLFNEQNARVLLLTYNKALVADIRRLLDLVGLPDDIAQGRVRPQTIHSFMSALFRACGLPYKGEEFLGQYVELKATAMEYLTSGAVSAAEIREGVKGFGENFDWHYVCVDEAQDCPEDERDLLRALYPSTSFIVADGVDQLVRRDSTTDWVEGLDVTKSTRVVLSQSLRMKAGLATFVNRLAQALKLPNWEIPTAGSAPGGRVVIVDRDYFDDPTLHLSLVKENESSGNAPVDMLVCVPPSLVHESDTVPGGSVGCVYADRFAQAGTLVWDGTADTTRSSYPTDVRQLRLIQYDSCRGLEGWTAILLGLDDFYRYKRDMYQTESAPPDGPAPSASSVAERFAARWLMIPLTRAIDTLVIQIGKGESPVRAALHAVHKLMPDTIEWYTDGQ